MIHKKSRHYNALIINACGLGDAIIEVPFINYLQKKVSMNFFHTSNPLFEDTRFVSKIGLSASFDGSVPPSWRKFDEQDWEDICKFCNGNNINLIINFRNFKVGPNDNYSKFKSFLQRRMSINFWDSSSIETEPSMNIRDVIHKILIPHIRFKDDFNRYFLSEYYTHESNYKNKIIGICMNTPDESKKWEYERWTILCTKLVETGYKLKIFAGRVIDEKLKASELTTILNEKLSESAELVEPSDLNALFLQLSKVSTLVSVDTGLVHIATSIKIPVVGIYVSTSASVWGGERQYMHHINSPHLKECHLYNPKIGICQNKRKLCPLVLKNGSQIEVNTVLDTALESVIKYSHEI
jgi:ADP-heptose:LPS heptosyltransferase